MNGRKLVLETDALIIGAGPAGSACAIELLKQGKKVAILERESFPRRAPGETLHPGIEPLLMQLGVMDQVKSSIATRHEGITTILDGIFKFVPYGDSGEWQGFQVSRSQFDKVLVEAAERLGALTHFQDTPCHLEKDNHGNIVRVLSYQLDVRARFVIDATGRRRWMADHLCVVYDRFSPTLISWYGYAGSKRSDRFRTPQLHWNSKGWTWLAEVGDSRVSWACLDVVEPHKRARGWLPKELREGWSIEKSRGRDVTWSIAQQLSDCNWFFVGDAAIVLDPASSHGILKAIMSGMMVSYLIGQFSSVPQSKIHQHYDDWMRKMFSADYDQLKRLYAHHVDGFEDYWQESGVL